MNGNKLDKADIGEMLVIAATASKSGIKQISIDSGDAASVLELAYNHDALVERIAGLEGFVRMVANGESADDSLKMAMSFAWINMAKQLLEKLK